MNTFDNSKPVGTRKPKKNFWVHITPRRPIDSPQSELEEWGDRFWDAGLSVARWAFNSQQGLKFLFHGEDRGVVRKVLIQCLLEDEIEECWIGPQRLAWDCLERPFIEHTRNFSRRYLDLQEDAPQPLAAVSTPLPQVARLTEVVQ